MLVIEAENFHSKANTSLRDWYIFPTNVATPKPDPDPPRDPSGVGGGKYVEILPDTRVTHDDPLLYDVNFFEKGNNAPRMNYLVRITTPGRYYFRARAYSTGTEDNGMHLGVNNNWPLSGQAVQWCDGKFRWTWSGARRTPQNHCGIENGIYLDLTAGDHTIMVGMREDGFELDRFILTRNSSYFPTGIGPAESSRTSGGSSSPANTAPVVNAGPDQTIRINESATLSGSASDDGLPNKTLSTNWRQVSGPGTATFANRLSLRTTVTFSAVGSYVLELSASDGQLTSTDRVGIAVLETSSSGGSDPGSGGAGQIVLGARDHSASISRGSHSWVAVTQSGTPAMRALPDTGARIHSNYVSTSPYLRFNVSFPTTGTYYVWLRGLCTGADNSAHVGLNGSAVAGAANLTLPVTGGWVWSGRTGGGQRATVNVTRTGSQTIEVYMREDGFTLGSILLTQNASYTPSGVVDGGSGSSPGTPSDPGVDPAGPIVLAAKAPNANVSRGSHSWVAVTQSGTPAMRALPDTGARIHSNYVSTSPYLRFNVSFPTTGTYYVWLRGLCTGADNSAHVGLNGSAVASAENLTLPVTGAWVWSGRTGGGQRATLNVTRTGSQTIEVYMREDGLTLESILLTQNASYTPSGAVAGGGGGGTPSGSAFLQSSSADGLVVMEAENRDATVSKGSHSWVAVNQGGTPAMQARPITGARIHSNYVSTSPYLRFNVNFQKTGTHYVWLRGLCTGNDNSAHVGLNGSAAASAENLTLPVTRGWVWSGTVAGGRRATLNITRTGLQTVEVYMREDGLTLDRLIITSSSTYSPSGTGPAQSPRG